MYINPDQSYIEKPPGIDRVSKYLKISAEIPFQDRQI